MKMERNLFVFDHFDFQANESLNSKYIPNLHKHHIFVLLTNRLLPTACVQHNKIVITYCKKTIGYCYRWKSKCFTVNCSWNIFRLKNNYYFSQETFQVLFYISVIQKKHALLFDTFSHCYYPKDRSMHHL